MNREEFLEEIKERRAHITIHELIKLLTSFSFIIRRTSKNHYIAQHKNKILSFAPPHPGKHVKKPYINEVIKIIEDIKKEELD